MFLVSLIASEWKGCPYGSILPQGEQQSFRTFNMHLWKRPGIIPIIPGPNQGADTSLGLLWWYRPVWLRSSCKKKPWNMFGTKKNMQIFNFKRQGSLQTTTRMSPITPRTPGTVYRTAAEVCPNSHLACWCSENSLYGKPVHVSLLTLSGRDRRKRQPGRLR